MVAVATVLLTASPRNVHGTPRTAFSSIAMRPAYFPPRPAAPRTRSASAHAVDRMPSGGRPPNRSG